MTPTDARTVSDRHLLWLLMAASAYAQASTGIYLPSLPAIAADLAASENAVQLTLAVYYFGYSVAMLAYGPLTDRFGRRRVLAWGTTIYIASSLACALAPSVEVLIAARVVHALGACSGFVVSRAVVRDRFEPRASARALSRIIVVAALSVGLSPVIGGQLHAWLGWRSCFAFLALFGLVLLPLVLWWMPETRPADAPSRERRRSALSNAAEVLRSRVFLGHSLAMAFGMATLFVFYAAGPVILIGTLGVAPTLYGAFTLAVQGAVTLGSMIAGRLSRRLGTARLLAGGLGVILTGAAALGVVALGGGLTIASFIMPILIIGIGYGAIGPAGQSGAINPFPHAAATASSLNGFLLVTMAGVGTTVLSALPGGIGWMAAVQLGLALAGCLSVTLLRGTARAG